MLLEAFGAAFGLTFIAEIGDKSQIMVLTLSARYGVIPVFLGASLAFIVLNGLAVSVGVLLYKVLPVEVIRYVVAGIFILYGLLSFRGVEEEERGAEVSSPLVSAFLVIALMEFGDKTQLSLVALTAKYSSPFSVFLGGTLALVLASLIGAIVGEGIGRVVPLKYVRFAGGIIFIAFGILVALGVW